MSPESLGVNASNKCSWTLLPSSIRSFHKEPSESCSQPSETHTASRVPSGTLSALGILSLETQCAHVFYTPSVDESQTLVFRFRYMLAVTKLKIY